MRPLFTRFQPPLGGCVLKQTALTGLASSRIQPPLGGCVLKRLDNLLLLGKRHIAQPPSGGCVLKHRI